MRHFNIDENIIAIIENLYIKQTVPFWLTATQGPSLIRR